MEFRTRRSRATIGRLIPTSVVSSTSARSRVAQQLVALPILLSQFACRVTRLCKGQPAHSIRYWELTRMGWFSLRVLGLEPLPPAEPREAERFHTRKTGT